MGFNRLVKKVCTYTRIERNKKKTWWKSIFSLVSMVSILVKFISYLGKYSCKLNMEYI
jgi:hypothetical protein